VVNRKQEKLEEARRTFEGTRIHITVEGERHLGAVVGNEYKERYIRDTIEKWVNEVSFLPQIVTTQPPAAHVCYTAGYQHKLTYFLGTIPEIENYLQLFEDVIRHHSPLPSLAGTSSTTKKD